MVWLCLIACMRNQRVSDKVLTQLTSTGIIPMKGRSLLLTILMVCAQQLVLLLSGCGCRRQEGLPASCKTEKFHQGKFEICGFGGNLPDWSGGTHPFLPGFHGRNIGGWVPAKKEGRRGMWNSWRQVAAVNGNCNYHRLLSPRSTFYTNLYQTHVQAQDLSSIVVRS